MICLDDKIFKAIRLILSNTDKHSEQMFMMFEQELKAELPKYNSADEYFYKLNARTDMSQDDKWELECLESVVEAIYLLEGRQIG